MRPSVVGVMLAISIFFIGSGKLRNALQMAGANVPKDRRK